MTEISDLFDECERVLGEQMGYYSILLDLSKSSFDLDSLLIMRAMAERAADTDRTCFAKTVLVYDEPIEAETFNLYCLFRGQSPNHQRQMAAFTTMKEAKSFIEEN